MLNLEDSPAKRANDLPFATAGDCDWDHTHRTCVVNNDGDLVAAVFGAEGEKQAAAITTACNAHDLLLDALGALIESGSPVPRAVRERIDVALVASGQERPEWRDQLEGNVKMASFDLLLNTAVAAASMLRMAKLSGPGDEFVVAALTSQITKIQRSLP